jgi:Zn-dependent M28 family amino/carboxypeptidase
MRQVVIIILVLTLLALIAAVAGVAWRKRSGMVATVAGPLTRQQQSLASELQRDVSALCELGPRTIFRPGSLPAAADWIEAQFREAGYEVERQRYRLVTQSGTAENLIVEIPGIGAPEEIVVIGAHYDTVEGTVGADDNASGVAGLLALARRFHGSTPGRTLRFLAFANEEPPLFQTPDMGSWQYAKRCRDRGEVVVGMLSLEMLGYYDEARGSQQYPPPLAALYPDRGNFIGFAGNLASRALVAESVRAFRERTSFPAESAILPEIIPEIGWSDQWAFWQFGWQGLMVTDTALYRNPYYHTPSDRPETLDYPSMARVVEGLEGVVEALVNRNGDTPSSRRLP